MQSVLSDLLKGLAAGLSGFAGPTRIGAIVAGPDMELSIHDPAGLFKEHSKFIEENCNKSSWQADAQRIAHDEPNKPSVRHTIVSSPANLAVLRAISPSVPFQMWVAEISERVGRPEIILNWLLETAVFLVNAMLSEKSALHGANSAENYIANFSNGAVRRFVSSKVRFSKYFDMTAPFLQLSMVNEEQKGASGQVILAPRDTLTSDGLFVRFDSSHDLRTTDTKQMRKLLTAVGSNMHLACDEDRIVGIYNRIPSNSFRAEFKKGRAQLFVGGTFVCSILNGRLKSFCLPPALAWPSQVLEICNSRDVNVQAITAIVRSIVKAVYDAGGGCTLVIDLSLHGLNISGLSLSPAMKLEDEQTLLTAGLMAMIDGALYIEKSGTLKKFGCLLDGAAIPSESLARGARYNSALRFSAKHPEDALILIVSSDGSISYFWRGKDQTRSMVGRV